MKEILLFSNDIVSIDFCFKVLIDEGFEINVITDRSRFVLKK